MTYTMYEFIYLHVNTKYGKHKTARKQNKRKQQQQQQPQKQQQQQKAHHSGCIHVGD